MNGGQPFALVGAFASSAALADTARQLRSLGFRDIEAYTPYPVAGLDVLLRPGRRTWLPLVIFLGALFGAAWGYFIQYWDEALNYPINVGGRPHNSWPAFVVGTFEFMVLCAVAAAFFGLLLSCRLPRLYDPIFTATEFERASVDRFFLCIEARDPSFDAQRLRRIFERHGAECSPRSSREADGRSTRRREESPSPPFREAREGSGAQRLEGGVGSVANRTVGPPHPTLYSRPAGEEGQNGPPYYPPAGSNCPRGSGADRLRQHGEPAKAAAL